MLAYFAYPFITILTQCLVAYQVLAVVGNDRPMRSAHWAFLIAFEDYATQSGEGPRR